MQVRMSLWRTCHKPRWSRRRVLEQRNLWKRCSGAGEVWQQLIREMWSSSCNDWQFWNVMVLYFVSANLCNQSTQYFHISSWRATQLIILAIVHAGHQRLIQLKQKWRRQTQGKDIVVVAAHGVFKPPEMHWLCKFFNSASRPQNSRRTPRNLKSPVMTYFCAGHYENTSYLQAFWTNTYIYGHGIRMSEPP